MINLDITHNSNGHRQKYFVSKSSAAHNCVMSAYVQCCSLRGQNSLAVSRASAIIVNEQVAALKALLSSFTIASSLLWNSQM